MPSQADALVELNGVCKQYPGPDGGAPVAVLRGVSLRVNAGDTVAIVGPSGSGKSTLLNLLGALDRPSEGEVRFRGRSLDGLSERDLAPLRNRDVGFVFQLHHLLPQCTVLENVLLPSLAGGGRVSEAVERRGRTLLDRVGLAGRLQHRPDQLSGGERQRAAVVRALINQPALVLADEPTGSLDHAAANDLIGLLTTLNAELGTALVVVTHAETLAGGLQRIYRLGDGDLQPQPKNLSS